MTTLYVSPYAPYRDGIANYAVQDVAQRRSSGEDLEVLSPVPSAAHHHLPLGTPRGLAQLVARAGRYDQVVIQFFPDLLFGGCRTRWGRRAAWMLLRLLCLRVPVEIRVHEIDYPAEAGTGLITRLTGDALRSAARITVHTAAERDKLVAAFGLAPGSVELIDHGGSFRRRTPESRSGARAGLGIPEGAFVFLSIGFVQRHKGFDRAVIALDRLARDSQDVRLYVVGDIRIDHPDLLGYRDELVGVCAQVPGAEFRSGYVSDEEFDRWIVAADRVVLPYREIWSSGVVERAHLYGVPVIASDVGGLTDQLHEADVAVADDDALASAMAEAAGVDIVESTIDIAKLVASGRTALEDHIRARAGTADRSDHAIDAITYTPRGPMESTRVGFSVVKRAVARLTAWQIDPVAAHVDRVIDAVRSDVDHLESRLDAHRRDERL